MSPLELPPNFEKIFIFYSRKNITGIIFDGESDFGVHEDEVMRRHLTSFFTLTSKNFAEKSSKKDFHGVIFDAEHYAKNRRQKWIQRQK